MSTETENSMPAGTDETPGNTETAAAGAPSAAEVPGSDDGIISTVAVPHRDASNPVLEMRSVTRRYGKLTALDSLTMTVARGSIHGFIGPNGAGKTTAFSLVAGFLRPNSGDILICGRPASEGVDCRRGILGILPQDARLPAKDKVGEALTFYARLQGFSSAEAEAEARKWLERVGMIQSWDTRCGALSHGMSKRVGIAQAFLGSPRLVLLDEPTAGIDPANAHQIRELIRTAHSEGASILVSSHNLAELEALCDYATILDHGKVQTQGTLAELTSASSEIRIQTASDAVPEEALSNLWAVRTFTFDKASRTLTVTLTSGVTSPEPCINEILKTLIQHNVLIGGVSKGHGLEAKVISLNSDSASGE